MDTALPKIISFRNEKGQLVEQKVSYEWKPTLCKYCKKYAHSQEICRKKAMPTAVNKQVIQEPVEGNKQITDQKMQGQNKDRGEVQNVQQIDEQKIDNYSGNLSIQ